MSAMELPKHRDESRCMFDRRVLNSLRHAGAKVAKPEQLIDNSLLGELEKSGFVNHRYAGDKPRLSFDLRGWS
jgi:hypothetical protein